MPASPNPLNYSVLKGKLFFTPTVGGVERALGNAPAFQLSPEIERLDHFSSMVGVRAKDRSIIVEKSMIANITLDEITAENLQLALLGGTITAGPPKNFKIFDASEITGALRFEGTNDVGNQVDLALPNVSFGPAGEIDFISDEWAQIELEAEVLYDTVTAAFGTCTVVESAAPNIGSVSPNTGPAAGGTAVTITGTNLTGATGVTFGGVAGTSFSVASATEIDVTTPAHAAGAVAVVVAHPSGNATLPAGFTYS